MDKFNEKTVEIEKANRRLEGMRYDNQQSRKLATSITLVSGGLAVISGIFFPLWATILFTVLTGVAIILRLAAVSGGEMKEREIETEIMELELERSLLTDWY